MSTKIRFVVYNAYGIGGTIKTVFNFANYFYASKKYDVEIISIKRNAEKPMLYLDPKIKITVIQDARRGAKYSAEDRMLLGMPSRLIDEEEDLYSMFNGYTDKRLTAVLKGMHDGVLVTTMPSFNVLSANIVDNKVLKIGQEHKSYADHTPGIQKLIRENYGKLDAVTILTERNRSVYHRKIQGEVPIYVLGNGTEHIKFKASLKNHIIIAAGRYSPEKGYDMLIKAFSKIKDSFPDWIVKIYGNGSLEKEYIDIIRECNAEDRILLMPGTNGLNEKLSEAAFQVCSSHRESFGMSILEGFAMGIPCVSFACDGPMELITHEKDGLLVAKEDINGLAETMARLMSDEELRLELGNNAYETSKKYDIKVIGNMLMTIVEKESKIKKAAPPKNNAENAVKKDISSENLDTPMLMIATASNGKIGLRTIVKMFFGWLKFKIKK